MPTPFKCTNCSELKDRIRWLENGLKEIVNADVSTLYVKQKAQGILDGEPTTADEFNKNKCPIPGSRDYWEPKNEDETLEYKENMSNDKKLKDPNHPNPFNRKSNRFKPFSKNVVYISDINKEIAKEWKKEDVKIDFKDRAREKRIQLEREQGED